MHVNANTKNSRRVQRTVLVPGLALVFASLVCVGGLAWADDDLTKIGEETVFLRAQIERERARAELRELQLQSQQRPSVPDASRPPVSAAEMEMGAGQSSGAGSGAEHGSYGDFRVQWVEVFGGVRIAGIRTATGAIVEVKQGDTLPGGARVTAVTPNSVKVSESGRLRELPFGFGSAAGAAGSAAVNF